MAGKRAGRGSGALVFAALTIAIAGAALTVVEGQKTEHMAQTAAASLQGLVGPIVTSGSTLVDTGTGKVVHLKGVNAPDSGFDPASIATLRSWGANYVRIGVSDDFYEQNCAAEHYDSNYVSNLDAEVNTLTADGIYVLIAEESTNPNCAFVSPQYSGVFPLPGPGSLAMFASLAHTFGANPLVGFEPFNEPEVCPDSALQQSPLVPLDQLDQDLELVYPQNALTDPASRLAVPTFGTCDGWIGGYPNLSGSNWSQRQAENLSAYALLKGGSVRTTFAGVPVTYTGEGFETIVATLRSNGATNNLVFVDANGWAHDTATFDYLSSGGTCQENGQSFSPCWANLTNYVAVEHYYGCLLGSTGVVVQKLNCSSAVPESCKQISANLSHGLTDPATGAAWSIPLVIDEFGWPQPAPLPMTTVYYDTSGNSQDVLNGKPILTYQHGLFMQNVVSFLDQHGVGWAAFRWDNGDHDAGAQGPWVLESGSPVPTSTNVPWAPNADGTPVYDSMQGQAVPCQEPPPGFG